MSPRSVRSCDMLSSCPAGSGPRLAQQCVYPVMDRRVDVAPRNIVALAQTVAFQAARLLLVDTSCWGQTIMMME